MTKKRQTNSIDVSSTINASKKSANGQLMTFDEIAAIIQSTNSEKLREIIEAGRVRDINKQNNDKNQTLLSLACKCGSLECARVLLDHNADANYRCSRVYSDSVLKSACLSGSPDVIRLVVERGAVVHDLELSRLFGERGIAPNTAIATILVGYVQDVNFVSTHGSLIFLASCLGHVHIVRALLERGVSLTFDGRYSDPLEIACRSGYMEIVKLILGRNKEYGRVSQESVTLALKSASWCGHIEIVRDLIEYGPCLMALTHALYQTIERNKVEVAALLLDNGASFKVLIPGCGRSTWITACRKGSPGMVRLLLDRGADAKDQSAMKAALCNPEVLIVLLEHGADPNQYVYGSKPLLDLLQREQGEDKEQVLAILLEHGADPNIAQESTGETPLMIAALGPHVDLVKQLLEHGADVTQVNREGKSVLDLLGRTRKYGEVVELCTQYIDSNKPGVKLLLK